MELEQRRRKLALAGRRLRRRPGRVVWSPSWPASYRSDLRSDDTPASPKKHSWSLRYVSAI